MEYPLNKQAMIPGKQKTQNIYILHNAINRNGNFYEKNIETVSMLFEAYILAQYQAVQGECFPHFPIQDYLAGRPTKVFESSIGFTFGILLLAFAM